MSKETIPPTKMAPADALDFKVTSYEVVADPPCGAASFSLEEARQRKSRYHFRLIKLDLPVAPERSELVKFGAPRKVMRLYRRFLRRRKAFNKTKKAYTNAPHDEGMFNHWWMQDATANRLEEQVSRWYRALRWRKRKENP